MERINQTDSHHARTNMTTRKRRKNQRRSKSERRRNRRQNYSMSNPRTIKLLCPSVSNLIQFVAWDEQGLDLGSIARAFGLDPSTVKLNGHFISRGFDFVSSSVTWRSLLKFFSAKGLSTGKDDKDALIVDGKLSKVGSKRKFLSIPFMLIQCQFFNIWGLIFSCKFRSHLFHSCLFQDCIILGILQLRLLVNLQPLSVAFVGGHWLKISTCSRIKS